MGMATNMPTHNLSEVIDGCCAYIDNEEINTEELMQYIQAPDFPTRWLHLTGLQGVKDAYETGRGRVVMRAKAEIESDETKIRSLSLKFLMELTSNSLLNISQI